MYMYIYTTHVPIYRLIDICIIYLRVYIDILKYDVAAMQRSSYLSESEIT